MAAPRTVHLLDDAGNIKPLASLEAEIIAAALARCGNLTHLAEALGIGRTTLYRKLREYNLKDDIHGSR